MSAHAADLAGSSGESLVGGYGRWVIDLKRGWPTERLDLEPLAVAHAAELAPQLDDAALHELTGGAPLSAAALAARYAHLATRYAHLAARRSPGGGQLWGNWVIRVRATGVAAGTVQATLPAVGLAAGPAEVAWVVARAAQGRSVDRLRSGRYWRAARHPGSAAPGLSPSWRT